MCYCRQSDPRLHELIKTWENKIKNQKIKEIHKVRSGSFGQQKKEILDSLLPLPDESLCSSSSITGITAKRKRLTNRNDYLPAKYPLQSHHIQWNYGGLYSDEAQCYKRAIENNLWLFKNKTVLDLFGSDGKCYRAIMKKQ